MCFVPQRRALFRHLNVQKWSSFLHFRLGNVLRATTASTFSTSQLPKLRWTWCALCIVTWKCASRDSGVHFVHIKTSKSGPKLVCFVHFDLQMCFGPQRRALFWHLNFQEWSEAGVLCTFWLANVLRASTACTFSTSQLPKVVRSWCALYILTCKCASRLNGVHFFDISTSKSGPKLVHRVLWIWLGNVLRATTACTFLTSQLPRVVRSWCALYILTCKCASRLNGVHFFDIATSKSTPKLKCFVHFCCEMCFAPQRRAIFNLSLLFDHPERQIIAKTHWIATFLPFRAPAFSFFSLFLFSALLTSWLLSLTLPTSAFPSVHVVGSLTSKLPSITYFDIRHMPLNPVICH